MQRKTKMTIGIYAAVAGLLIFLSVFKIFNPVESGARQIINPVIKFFYGLTSTTRTKYGSQVNQGDLSTQVKSLTAERNRLIEDNVKLQMVKEENGVLREQLGFISKNKYHYVVSNVISRGELNNSAKSPEAITIDKGTKDGVSNGLSVVSGDGIIVGKVVDVKDNISRIDLTNNLDCKLAATMLGDTKTNGITSGDLGLTIKMDFIPQTVVIKPGDLVITSGLEEAIPRGLAIGKVSAVTKESNDLWQSAVIEPLVSPDDLIIVSVLLP
jgi:rod shape-determining protein MreC